MLLAGAATGLPEALRIDGPLSRLGSDHDSVGLFQQRASAG